MVSDGDRQRLAETIEPDQCVERGILVHGAAQPVCKGAVDDADLTVELHETGQVPVGSLPALSLDVLRHEVHRDRAEDRLCLGREW